MTRKAKEERKDPTGTVSRWQNQKKISLPPMETVRLQKFLLFAGKREAQKTNSKNDYCIEESSPCSYRHVFLRNILLPVTGAVPATGMVNEEFQSQTHGRHKS